MSRIGRLPVKIPAGVTAGFADGKLTVKGPLGALTQAIDSIISVEINGGEILFTRINEQKTTKAKHGLYRALCQNMVTGVTQGFTKSLLVQGVGYKVSKSGNKLIMDIGYSHNVEVVQPEGITLECPTPTEIVVKGIDKDAVGQCAANIKAAKKVEPYHGYGIRYKDEVVVLKEGKSAGK